MQDNKTHSLHGIVKAATTRGKSRTVGFTIVELLIVIVVIGILAAITIVAYNGIQQRAYDTTIRNDLNTLNKVLELRKVDADNYIVSSTMGFKASSQAYAINPTTPYNLLFCLNPPTYSQYWVAALSKSGKKFIISSNSNTVSEYTGEWETSQSDMCVSLGAPSPGASNNRGYAADDTMSGPWRSWTGVGN